MQPPSRCRIPKNAPRAALHRTRGFYWENSAPSLSFRSRLRCESRNQGRQAPRVLSLSAQPCKYLLYTGLSRGVRLYRRSLRVVEPLARTAYNPDIRAWPCFVAHLAVCLPIGNADFGWAVARWSCGRDQVGAGKEAMMATGTVKWFNPTKGYGFIQPQDGGRDVFVHISAVERAGLSSLNEGQVVEYEMVSNRGKESADNLKTR